MLNSKSNSLPGITSPETKEIDIPLRRRSERVRNFAKKNVSTVSDTDTDDSDDDEAKQASFSSRFTTTVNRKRKRDLDDDDTSEENLNSGEFNTSSAEASSETPFECDQCDKKFKLFKYLRKHEKYVHTDEATEFECLPCNKKFRKKDMLKQHKRTKIHVIQVEKGSLDNNSSGKDEELKLNCDDQCDKKFILRSNLLRHYRDVHVHTEELAFECSLCNKKFKSGASLSQHIRSAEHMRCEEKHISNILQMTYSDDAEEKRPRLENDVSKMLLVNEGKLARENVSNLSEHSCNICGKILKTKRYLYLHQMLHNGNAPMECLICEKKFQTKNNYNHHLQSQIHKKLSLIKKRQQNKEIMSSKSLEKLPPPNEQSASKISVKREVALSSKNIPENENNINDNDIQLGVMSQAGFQSVPNFQPQVENKVLPPFQENNAIGNFQRGMFQSQNDTGLEFPLNFQFPFSFPAYPHFSPQSFYNQRVYQGGIPWNPMSPLQNTYFPIPVQPNAQQAENEVGAFHLNPRAG